MIDQAIKVIEQFQGSDLTESISRIEGNLVTLGRDDVQRFCESMKIDDSFLDSALSVKKIAGQINVIIHAAGILRSLQSIMELGEVVESLSLGAGNTGRKFDLETNYRVAEYKFIDWRGGPETIRQNGVFKDFYELGEYETTKRKYLYVVGTEYPLKFFHSGRALSSVLSRQPIILKKITEKHGSNIKLVCDYYRIKQQEVNVCNIAPHIGRAV